MEINDTGHFHGKYKLAGAFIKVRFLKTIAEIPEDDPILYWYSNRWNGYNHKISTWRIKVVWMLITQKIKDLIWKTENGFKCVHYR